MRGSDAADNAVRARQVARAAGGVVDTPDARLLVKQRTQLINMIPGLLAEFGVDIPKGLIAILPFGYVATILHVVS